MLPWSNDLKLLFLDAKLPPELEEFRRLLGDFIPQNQILLTKANALLCITCKDNKCIEGVLLKKLNRSSEERWVIWQNNAVFE